LLYFVVGIVERGMQGCDYLGNLENALATSCVLWYTVFSQEVFLQEKQKI
jgi:hypothetical protein